MWRHTDRGLTLQDKNRVGVKLEGIFSTFSTMPRSPSAMTRLTIVPAFWAIEYAEATNRISKVGLEAMTSPEGKWRERFCYFQSQLLVSFTWIQFDASFSCAYSGLPRVTAQILEETWKSLHFSIPSLSKFFGFTSLQMAHSEAWGKLAHAYKHREEVVCVRCARCKDCGRHFRGRKQTSALKSSYAGALEVSKPEVCGIKLLSAERRLNSRGAVGLCGVIKKGRDCVWLQVIHGKSMNVPLEIK